MQLKITRKQIAYAALVLAVLFLLRGTIIRTYADSKIAKAQERYNLAITYKTLKPKGIAGIELEGLCVVPTGKDTLFSVSRLKIVFNPWKIVLLKPDLRKLEADAAHLNFIKTDSANSNFDFLYNLRPTTDPEPNPTHKTNYAKQADNIARILFDLVPKKASMRDMKVTYHNNGDSLVLSIPTLEIKNQAFKTTLQAVENSDTNRWSVSGTISNSDRQLQATIHSTQDKKIKLPFLEYRWGARVAFDTISFGLVADRIRSGQVALSGKASIAGLTLYHRRISPEDVILDNGEIDYRINIGENFSELDSSTVVSFNKLAFNPYLRVERNEDWRLIASVNKRDFAADDFFSSLPKGLFYNLEGIRTRGRLSYRFLLDADLAQLDSLRFESHMQSDGFSIEAFGNTDLRRMNGEFTYTVYENDAAVKSFVVGASNPDFCTLESVSPLLRMAVMQSEDGAFFYHNGFLIDCMRDAIIHDIRERRFARGGSTITMQLVKNVFLNRNKTIARKLEEALIVWLIEGQRLTSKQRMYEVYLNIAEWGPGVYGVREAARYYFDKKPGDLSVEEAIFMAELIPHPKRTLSSFDDSLRLKPYYEEYYRLLATRLEKKGEISAEQAASIRPEVTLRGAARETILERIAARSITNADTVAVDVSNIEQ